MQMIKAKSKIWKGGWWRRDAEQEQEDEEDFS
jgi:hypothetical protein